MDLRRIMLFGLAGSLTICALFAIIVVVFRTFNEISFKIILTTLSVGFYSLMGLCCTPHLQGDIFKRRLALVGIRVSAIGLLFACVTNWMTSSEWSRTTSLLQFLFFFVVLALALAHVSLLLLITPKNNTVKLAQNATIACIAANAALILINTSFPAIITTAFIVPILVLSILDALGSIVTPVLHFASRA